MNQILFFLLVVASAVYAGACLSIGSVDLPFVRNLAASEVVPVFADLVARMGKLMIPQLVILLAGCSYFSFLGIKSKQSWTCQIPLSVFVLIVLITLSVHIPINKAVISGAVPAEELQIYIERWYVWHWIRTAAALAFPFAIGRFYKVFV